MYSFERVLRKKTAMNPVYINYETGDQVSYKREQKKNGENLVLYWALVE